MKNFFKSLRVRNCGSPIFRRIFSPIDSDLILPRRRANMHKKMRRGVLILSARTITRPNHFDLLEFDLDLSSEK